MMGRGIFEGINFAYNNQYEGIYDTQYGGEMIGGLIYNHNNN